MPLSFIGRFLPIYNPVDFKDPDIQDIAPSPRLNPNHTSTLSPIIEVNISSDEDVYQQDEYVHGLPLHALRVSDITVAVC